MKKLLLIFLFLIPLIASAQPAQETDPRAIWKDASAGHVATALQPFALGLSVPDNTRVLIGGAGPGASGKYGNAYLRLFDQAIGFLRYLEIGADAVTTGGGVSFAWNAGSTSASNQNGGSGQFLAGNSTTQGNGGNFIFGGGSGIGAGKSGGKVRMQGGGASGGASYGYVQAGNGGTPGHLDTAGGNSINSLFVQQDLEVDGATYLDGALNVVGTTTLATALDGLATLTAGVVGELNGVQGDVVYYSGTNTLAVLNKNASATRYLSNTGSSNNPAWAQVDLSTGVTGTLPASAIPDADDDATTKGVSTYTNNDFNATSGLVSINQAGTFAWTGSQSFVGAGGFYNSTVIIGDEAFATDHGPSSNVGAIQFTNANNLAAGITMEVDEILSIGINVSQLKTSYDSTRQGVIFRLDARQTFPVFSVIMQDHQDIIGGGASVEYFPLQVSEQATVTIGAAAFEGEYDTQASLYVKQGLGGGYSIKTDADIYSQGEIWIANSNPILYLVDSGGDDWKIDVLTGSFRVSNTTDGVVPLIIDPTSWRATFSNVLRANTIEAAASSAQIVFDATAGVTTTLQDSASLTSKTITLPNVTATLAHTGSGSQTFAGAVTLSSTLIVSGLATFKSTSGITLSSTSPMITFTDTTASEDDFILLTDSAGGWKIRNSTDSRDDFRISGDGKVAISTNYSPLTSTKLYVTDRITDAAAAASYAFQANLEVQTAADWSGGNLRGFAGGIVYNSPGFDFNNGSALIGLDGLVQVYIQSGDVVNNVNGVFGEASIDGATTGGTVTSLSAVGTFINIQRAAAVTTAYLFRASNVQLQTSGTVGTVYAFYDTGQTVATTNNWGFYGLTSKNYLSGDLYFGQTDGAEKIESSADNLLDLYAGTTLNFRIGSTAEASLTATVFNITGELDLDGALNHDGTTAGFFSAAPVTQRTNIGALTDSTGGSVDGTLADVGAVPTQADINNNFADIADRINKIEQVLQDLGLTN